MCDEAAMNGFPNCSKQPGIVLLGAGTPAGSGGLSQEQGDLGTHSSQRMARMANSSSVLATRNHERHHLLQCSDGCARDGPQSFEKRNNRADQPRSGCCSRFGFPRPVDHPGAGRRCNLCGTRGPRRANVEWPDGSAVGRQDCELHRPRRPYLGNRPLRISGDQELLRGAQTAEFR
jgi:hypothetical protein